MLEAIGVESLDELVAHVPAGAARARAARRCPPGLTEPELRERFAALAARNAGDGAAVFLGAGAYPHFVAGGGRPASLLAPEFATAYTPYQPEVSQGTLQAIFEFQTIDRDAARARRRERQHVRRRVGDRRGGADGAAAPAGATDGARLARALHPHYREP